MERFFDDDYAEDGVLRDGTRVHLRLVRPTDDVLLRRGFEALSDESRYRRFLTPKARLTDSELKYLTDVDQESHFALGAALIDAFGREEPVGIARFVRLTSDPVVAEAAVTVLDSVQGRGLGSLLLLRLIAAAQERGIERFRCIVLAENSDMRGLMHHVLPESRDRADGNAVVIEAPLPDVEPSQPERDRPVGHWTYDLLRRTASGTLSVLGDLLQVLHR